MFVDASALVAILTREPEAGAFADALDGADAAITSPIAVFEATLGVCRTRHASVAEGEQDVRDLLAAAAIGIDAVTDADARGALEAFARYGKGRGHPAQLDMGDRFAYAAAKRHGTSLLFTGADFSATDVVAAV